MVPRAQSTGAVPVLSGSISAAHRNRQIVEFRLHGTGRLHAMPAMHDASARSTPVPRSGRDVGRLDGPALGRRAARGERQRREDRRGAQGAGARPGRLAAAPPTAGGAPAPLSRRAGCGGGGGLLFGAGGTCSGGGVLLFGAQALVAALLNGGRACRQRGGGAAARAVGVAARRSGARGPCHGRRRFGGSSEAAANHPLLGRATWT